MQQEIKRKQNEPQMLCIQFAAKVYCNKAEKLNYLVWILCISATLLSLLIVNENNISMGCSIIIEIMAFVFQLLMDRDASLFSEFRKCFDRYVLFDETYNFNDKTVACLNAVIRREDYQVQITNNGHDTPPGVKDWYEFSVDYNGNEMDTILECQRQNGYWTKKLMQIKQLITLFIGAIIVILIICVIKVRKIDHIHALVGLIALILKFIERIWMNYKYSRMIPEIDGALKSASLHGNKEQALFVQDCIENLREMPIFGMNIIHKIFAKKYSNEYHNIQQMRSPHE